MTATPLWARRRRVGGAFCLLVCYMPLALALSQSRRAFTCSQSRGLASLHPRAAYYYSAVLYRSALRFYRSSTSLSQLSQVLITRTPQ